MRRLCASLLVAGCAAFAVSCQTNWKASGSNGTWAGTTSQGKRLLFVADENTITRVEFGWEILLDEPCRTDPDSPIAEATLGGEDTLSFSTGSPGAEPPRIVNGVWRLERSPIVGRIDLSLAMTGKLARGEATGELTLKALTGCKGEMKATWKALLTSKQSGPQGSAFSTLLELSPAA